MVEFLEGRIEQREQLFLEFISHFFPFFRITDFKLASTSMDIENI
jgi:hypothetical protein